MMGTSRETISSDTVAIRSMVGRAGVTLYRVGGMKDVPGVRTYVSVDGGMSDLMRPMLYGAVYEPLLANRADEEPSATVRLVEGCYL